MRPKAAPRRRQADFPCIQDQIGEGFGQGAAANWDPFTSETEGKQSELTGLYRVNG
jgi:hypothetical protein